MWLLTGDLHLSSNPRDAYRFKFMKWLAQYIEQRHISTLILLGDLTMEKDRHDAWLVNEIADWMKRLAEVTHLHMLKGNHDYLVEHEPFFQFLDHINRIRYYNEPVAHGPGALFLPHTRDYKKEWAKFIKSKFEGFKFVFAHQTFEGANVGARRMDGIPTSIFAPKVQVFSGDIHVPQTTGPITYTGAPYTVNFGDNYQGRVILLDQDTGKTESIPYKGPQKRLVENNGVVFTGKINKGDIVKLRSSMDSEAYNNWKDTREDLKKWVEKKGGVVHTIQPVVTTNRKKVTYKKIDPETDLQLVKTFAKKASASQSTLDVGLNILKETR